MQNMHTQALKWMQKGAFYDVPVLGGGNHQCKSQTKGEVCAVSVSVQRKQQERKKKTREERTRVNTR